MVNKTPISNLAEPTVTVAMSVFNGGPELELAVRSVVNQIFCNWELLILDDGSTDGAIDRLPFFDDPRVVLVRDGKNKGLSARLNQAIGLARGRYFARMDHDDICHPERFANQVAFLEMNPEIDLLATECVTMDEAEQIKGVLFSATEHAAICARPWLGFPMPHPSWMGRIQWFRKYLYQDPAPYCCEDNELLLRAYRASHYHTLPSRLLAYRVRTHTPWRKLWKTRKAMLQVQASYFYRQKEWGSLILACVAASLRVGRDMARELRSRVVPIRCTTDPSGGKTDNEWCSLISGLKRRVKRLG